MKFQDQNQQLQGITRYRVIRYHVGERCHPLTRTYSQQTAGLVLVITSLPNGSHVMIVARHYAPSGGPRNSHDEAVNGLHQLWRIDGLCLTTFDTKKVVRNHE
jgi:hypothetical protein